MLSEHVGLIVGVSSGSKLARRASVNGGVAAATVDVDLSEACIYEASSGILQCDSREICANQGILTTRTHQLRITVCFITLGQAWEAYKGNALPK